MFEAVVFWDSCFFPLTVFLLTEFVLSVSVEMSKYGPKHKEEISALQKAISTIDKEKDALQDDVDQKTEKLVALQDELTKKVICQNNIYKKYVNRKEKSLKSLLCHGWSFTLHFHRKTS